MRHTITNFTNSDEIEVSGEARTPTQRNYGGLVTIYQNAGSMNFQHGMTVSQARRLAQLLIDCADAAEAEAAKEAA